MLDFAGGLCAGVVLATCAAALGPAAQFAAALLAFGLTLHALKRP